MCFLFLLQYEAINQAACDLAKEVANEGDALVAGNISQVPAYLAGLGKEAVQKEFKKQTDIFVKNDVDFLIGEVTIPFKVATLLEGCWGFRKDYIFGGEWVI